VALSVVESGASKLCSGNQAQITSATNILNAFCSQLTITSLGPTAPTAEGASATGTSGSGGGMNNGGNNGAGCVFNGNAMNNTCSGNDQNETPEHSRGGHISANWFLLISCGAVVCSFLSGVVEGSGAGCTYVGGSQNDTCNDNSQTINNGTSSSSTATDLGVGLGIGIPSFLVSLAGVLVLFYKKRKKRQLEANAAALQVDQDLPDMRAGRMEKNLYQNYA
jgi:hypothetical protein